MANARVPHFDLPFRWTVTAGRRHAAEVDQDSPDEISVCVEAIIRTPIDSRNERQDFGTTEDVLFATDFDEDLLDKDIARYEPRAAATIDSDLDPTDEALRRIGVYPTPADEE